MGAGQIIQAAVMQGDADLTQRSSPLLEGVAICSVGELFGGVERHILGLLTGLQSHGVDALLILFHDGELAAQVRSQGIDPIILPGRNRSTWSTSQVLAEILRRRQIRIVHVHGYKATVICGLAHRRHQFVMVKTVHGLPEPMTGRPLHALRNKFYHFLDALATRMADSTVCYVTEELRLQHARAHSRLRATVIPNGVANMDKDQLQRPPELRKDWFNLAIVGRLDTVKGHHVAIKAISSQNVPEDVHLQVIGVGPTEAELRKLAHARGVADRVHFLGFRRNVYDYLAHCDVLLMPSLHEGLPYTLLEAMALKAPIIASRTGGLVEVIEHRITGLLIPVADSLGLGSAIRALYDGPELRKRLSDNARKLQQSRYSLDAMALRYLEEYLAALVMTVSLNQNS